MSKLVLFVIFICMILLPIVIHIIQTNNMKYYKLHGRKHSEIEKWLKRRKWYNLFKFNIQQEVLNGYKDDTGVAHVDDVVKQEIDDRLNEILTGRDDTSTISSAFSWRETQEGVEYWGEREHEFLSWYFGQYIDLHLIKY